MGECWLKKSHLNPSISSIKEHTILPFLQVPLNKIQRIKCSLVGGITPLVRLNLKDFLLYIKRKMIGGYPNVVSDCDVSLQYCLF